MATPQLDPYDEVLYDHYSYPESHVDRLASLALLHGMTPAPVENCRVLELACGNGSNLAAMACNLPESTFLGIDRAAKPIAQGIEWIKALQLRNLELRQADLMSTTEGLGEFDYIIAHGLYSWVPPSVRNRIMEICRSCLAPHGIAYISYNVYPGWRLQETIRDVMLFHTRDVKDPQEKVVEGRSLIDWLADSQVRTSAYSALLREIAKTQGARKVSAIYHDTLSEVNDPVYFHEFARHAAGYGLQFLCEAEHFNVRGFEFSTDVIKRLVTLRAQTVLTHEQYLDFLQGTSFRQTLLCHHEVEMKRDAEIENIGKLYLASSAQRMAPELDLRSDANEEFRTIADASITIDVPLVKAALAHLCEIFPQVIQFPELILQAQRRLGAETEVLDQERKDWLASIVLKAFGVGVVQCYAHDPGLSAKAGDRPLAGPLTRLQVQHGRVTTSLLGNNVIIDDPLGAQFLLLLDGTRDRKALIRDFGEIINRIAEPDQRTKLIEELPTQLEEKLTDLGRRALLVA